MKQSQTNAALIMTIYFVHDCAEMVRCSSVFRMSSIFAETSVSRTKKTLRGNWKVMFTHIWLSQPVQLWETARGFFVQCSTGLSFYQDFAHHMAMQCLVFNFASYISYQYLIFYLFTSFFFFCQKIELLNPDTFLLLTFLDNSLFICFFYWSQCARRNLNKKS